MAPDSGDIESPRLGTVAVPEGAGGDPMTYCRRGAEHVRHRSLVIVSREGTPPIEDPIDICVLTKLARKHQLQVESAVDQRFWPLFEAVRGKDDKCIKSVIHALRRVVGTDVGFPVGRAALRSIVASIPDPGGEATMLRSHIDLSDLGISKPVEFDFVDPIYAWVQHAAIAGEEQQLHFDAWQEVNGHEERLYGGGVECGDAMRQAIRRCPAGYDPALFAISFDKGVLGELRLHT